MSDLVKQLWLAGRGTIQVLAAVRIEELEKSRIAANKRIEELGRLSDNRAKHILHLESLLDDRNAD